MEPTPVYPPDPVEPAGHWLWRSLSAVLLERRLPTRLATLLDRCLIACGLRCRTINCDGLTFRVRRLAADEHFVRAIVRDREYSPSGYELRETDTVIDIGGNVGAFAVFAGRAVSRGQVISFEPVQDSFRLLEQNLAGNGLRNVTAVRAAVAGQSGPLQIHISRWGTGAHSIRPEIAGDSDGSESIEGLTLADVFERWRIERCHFLKLDCEGAEFEILDTLPHDLAARVDRIVLEYHTPRDADKHATTAHLVSRLQTLGFHIDRYTDDVGTWWGMIYARRAD